MQWLHEPQTIRFSSRYDVCRAPLRVHGLSLHAPLSSQHGVAPEIQADDDTTSV